MFRISTYSILLTALLFNASSAFAMNCIDIFGEMDPTEELLLQRNSSDKFPDVNLKKSLLALIVSGNSKKSTEPPQAGLSLIEDQKQIESLLTYEQAHSKIEQQLLNYATLAQPDTTEGDQAAMSALEKLELEGQKDKDEAKKAQPLTSVVDQPTNSVDQAKVSEPEVSEDSRVAKSSTAVAVSTEQKTDLYYLMQNFEVENLTNIKFSSKKLDELSFLLETTPEVRAYFVKTYLSSFINNVTKNNYNKFSDDFKKVEERVQLNYKLKPVFLGGSLVRLLRLFVKLYMSKTIVAEELSVQDAIGLMEILSIIDKSPAKGMAKARKDIIGIAHSVINVNSINEFSVEDLISYAHVLKKTKVFIPIAFEKAYADRLYALKEDVGFYNLLTINQNISYVDFEPVADMYTYLFETYRDIISLSNDSSLENKITLENKKLYLNLVATALFNQGAPIEILEPYLKLLEETNFYIQAPGNRKIQMLIMYAVEVKKYSGRYISKQSYSVDAEKRPEPIDFKDFAYNLRHNSKDGAIFNHHNFYFKELVFDAIKKNYPLAVVYNNHELEPFLAKIYLFVKSEKLIFQIEKTKQPSYQVIDYDGFNIKVLKVPTKVLSLRTQELYESLGYEVITVADFNLGLAELAKLAELAELYEFVELVELVELAKLDKLAGEIYEKVNTARKERALQ